MKKDNFLDSLGNALNKGSEIASNLVNESSKKSAEFSIDKLQDFGLRMTGVKKIKCVKCGSINVDFMRKEKSGIFGKAKGKDVFHCRDCGRQFAK